MAGIVTTRIALVAGAAAAALTVGGVGVVALAVHPGPPAAVVIAPPPDFGRPADADATAVGATGLSGQVILVPVESGRVGAPAASTAGDLQVAAAHR